MLEEMWRPRAELDMQSIFIFLAVECKNPEAAEKASAKIFGTIDMLKEFPDMGGSMLMETGGRLYRTMLVNPYVLYYTYTEDTLTIHRILHQRQDIDTYALIDFPAEPS